MVLVLSVQTITTTTYVANTIDTIFIEAADPTVNVILPAITQDGQIFKIKRVDTNDNLVFILGTGSDTVSYASSQNISNSQVFEFVSIDALKNWEITLNTSV
jgi:hypothetical protein